MVFATPVPSTVSLADGSIGNLRLRSRGGGWGVCSRASPQSAGTSGEESSADVDLLWRLEAAASNDVSELSRNFDAAQSAAVAVGTRKCPNVATTLAEDASGRTAAHVAAANGAAAALEHVITRSGPAAATARAGKDGRTPLHAAAEEGHLDCLILLLGANACVDATDHRSGMTALHRAAWRGRVACVRRLLDECASVNTRDNWGRTPLHWAVMPPPWVDDGFISDEDASGSLDAASSSDVLAMLLESRSDPEALTKGGRTPLQLAESQGTPALAIRQFLIGGVDSSLNCASVVR
eukprot:TRINITY_DN63517_c0_g1_i1.p1 TRINITY_DN63517_c0_g1~~TRINITY_DN63517_c0_g1_i1.p1  ORF type:complete len:295 (+),score=58.46 TRINITY_DN63517_c0_g1_i1:93-977(+)